MGTERAGPRSRLTRREVLRLAAAAGMAGTLLEEQDAIRRVAESRAREQMLVLLGTPTAGSTLMTALTLSQGDPSYAGALAGIPLGLPSYHILEDGVRDAIPDVYEREIGPLEFVLDKAEIVTALEKVRAETISP